MTLAIGAWTSEGLIECIVLINNAANCIMGLTILHITFRLEVIVINSKSVFYEILSDLNIFKVLLNNNLKKFHCERW